MLRPPPISTRPNTPFPYTTPFRSGGGRARGRRRAGKDTTGVRRRREPAARPRQRQRARARFGRTDRPEIGRQLRHGGTAAAGADACHHHSGRQGAGRRRREGRSEEHTSELQSLMRISYAVFCLKKQNQKKSCKITKQTKQ